MPTVAKKKVKAQRRGPMPVVPGHELKQVVLWTEKFPYSGHSQVIDAKSFNAWVAEMMPQTVDMKSYTKDKILEHAQIVGRYVFAVQEFKPYHWGSRWGGVPFLSPGAGGYEWKRSWLAIAQGDKRSKIRFSDTVRIPVLYKNRKNHDVVMSLTPLEVITLRPGLRKAKGRVLIGGLGLGWLARRVLEKKTVKHVTVVDIDKDVLDYFGEPLAAVHGDRLKREKADIYEYANAHGSEYDTILVDIWDTYQSALYNGMFGALKRRHPRVWGWGDCGS